jgi:hypothetical protein
MKWQIVLPEKANSLDQRNTTADGMVFWMQQSYVSIWMQQSYVSIVILPTPSQTVRNLFWPFRPAPDAALESISHVACSLSQSILVALPRGETQLVAAFPELTVSWKRKEL